MYLTDLDFGNLSIDPDYIGEEFENWRSSFSPLRIRYYRGNGGAFSITIYKGHILFGTFIEGLRLSIDR